MDDQGQDGHMPARQVLGRALDMAWNDWVSDTGNVPDALSIHGPRTTRVSARFEHSEFADRVWSWIEAAGFKVVPRG